MPRPNFFIVGAHKCGTTSLHYQLRQHPEIFMPKCKEPNYFNPDLKIHPDHSFSSEDRYLALFDGAGQARRIGEASPSYLRSKVAATRIHEFDPDARIIIMIRNPIEHVPSAHLQLVNVGSEDIIDLEAALNAIPERYQGRKLTPNSKYPCHFDYLDGATFSYQIQRYQNLFPAEAIHIIVQDDYRKDAARVLRDTFQFLGVDPDVVVDQEPKNVSRNVSSLDLKFKQLAGRQKWLHKLRRSAPPFAINAYRWITTRVSSRPAGLGTLSPAVRARLTEHFRPEIETLSQMLGRDFSHWLKA